MQTDTKVVGYGLLVTGLIIILLSGLNIYNILSGNSRSFKYFDFEPIEVSIEAFLDLSDEQRAALRAQNGGESPKMELVPENVLEDTTDLLAHIFLVGTLVGVGARISSIGAKLLRPVKVSLAKEKIQNA